MDKIKGVVLLGGPSKTTKLRPLSLDFPAPLIPIAGTEMLYHHCHALSKVPSISEILLIGFYRKEVFGNFIANTRNTLDIPIRYLEEHEPSGTGGSLAQFSDQIVGHDTKYIIIIHADICSNFPLLDMLRFHREQGKNCTMAAIRVEEEKSLQFGCLVENPKNHELVHYVERPLTPVSNLINCGIYIFSAAMFTNLAMALELKNKQYEASSLNLSPALQKLLHKKSWNPKYLSLEKDVFIPSAGKSEIVLYKMDSSKDFWFQIKNPISVLRSNAKYLEHYQDNDMSIFAKTPKQYKFERKENVLIHPTADVHPSAKIGPNCTIGQGVKIGSGVRISNSIIFDGCVIEPHACILNSIIGWNAIIMSWSRIEGTLELDKYGFEKLSILGVGVSVAPEIALRNCVVLPNKKLAENASDETIL